MIPSLATKYLRLQLRDANVIELRTLPEARSQRFSSVGPLLEALKAAQQRGQDCFATLNRPAELSLDGGAFKDADMGLITRLPLDFDPERPAGSSFGAAIAA